MAEEQHCPPAGQDGSGQEAGAESGSCKKQAVVLVHGMGEQAPMESLRAFVDAVWTSEDKSTRRTWIKPDTRAGLFDLRRITTNANEAGKRTDFYEFYWADLMQGTTWQHLTGWVSGLLVRDPKSVPPNVMPLWVYLWISLFVLALIWIFDVPGNSTKAASETCSGLLTSTSEKCASEKAGFFEGIIWFINYILNAWENRIIKNIIKILFLSIPIIIFILKYISLNIIESKRRIISCILIIVGTLIYFLLISVVIKEGYFFTVFSIFGLLLLHGFIVPYFGDVARYVQEKPANIEKRAAVRERGLQLFRQLHDCGDYDRIVVVAHSLGTIIAYDLLSLLWTEYGPNKRNLPNSAAIEKMEKLDDWLRGISSNAGEGDPETYRKHQRAIWDALRTARDPEDGYRPWLISNFVTLGSPLTHAEFLLARDEGSLENKIYERKLAVSPPVLEPDSFLYKGGPNGECIPHHAAVFCAVRWTNIYDQANSYLPLRGDIISGPMKGHFSGHIWRVDGSGKPGKCHEGFMGVTDIKADIGCRRWPPLGWITSNKAKFFTHTKYWKWVPCVNGAENDALNGHIAALRKAIDLPDTCDKCETASDTRAGL